MLRNRNISCFFYDCWFIRFLSSLVRRVRFGRWLGGGVVGRVFLDSDCGVYGFGFSGGFFIFGSQIFYVFFDLSLFGVVIEFLVFFGGEVVGRVIGVYLRFDKEFGLFYFVKKWVWKFIEDKFFFWFGSKLLLRCFFFAVCFFVLEFLFSNFFVRWGRYSFVFR